MTENSNWTDTKVGKIPVCLRALTDGASTLSLTGWLLSQGLVMAFSLSLIQNK